MLLQISPFSISSKIFGSSWLNWCWRFSWSLLSTSSLFLPWGFSDSSFKLYSSAIFLNISAPEGCRLSFEIAMFGEISAKLGCLIVISSARVSLSSLFFCESLTHFSNSSLLSFASLDSSFSSGSVAFWSWMRLLYAFLTFFETSLEWEVPMMLIILFSGLVRSTRGWVRNRSFSIFGLSSKPSFISM